VERRWAVALLRTDSLTKRFGGITAVNDVSFEVNEGEIVGLIGPNGAGKTTVFNLISGLFPPSGGRIYLADEDITPLKSYRRSLLGIGRTFQVVRPFTDMTVLENVMVPASVRGHGPQEARELSLEILGRVGLHDEAYLDPQNLTLSKRKRLEVARALATEPKVLLLDEVLAGLNPPEVKAALPLIHRIREGGVTVLIIEHLMAALMSVSDRVLVMDRGELISSGTPSEVTNDPEVIKAYLGDEAASA
jgi:branched-chain amino acid transport system ATP-binding protein